MTRALPFTQASLARAIKGVEKAGRHVVGIRLPDGTLIIADKPVDVASLVLSEAQISPPSARRFGEKLNGGQGEPSRA
jgi:hypothetical protein